MPLEHEYSLHGGPERARIGQILGMVAAFASAVIAAIVLQLVQLAEMVGWEHSKLILWPLGAVTMYGILYWWFNNYLWKQSQLREALRVPDLNGEWTVDGQTINPDLTLGFTWQGTMTIVQRTLQKRASHW